MTHRAIACAIICVAGIFQSPAFAENIINPPRSGWVDVSKSPYNADTTGKTDVTAILQKAINDNDLGPGNSYRTIYLPNGNYLVSNTVQWSTGNSQGPVFQGQSRKGVVIRLKDGTFTGTGSTASPKAVLATGDGVAQNFNKAIFNLTVNIGSNNSGACGVYFYSNNEGIIENVDIISEDGQGSVGLHLGNGEQGPCMARKIYVKGFKYGVWGDALNSVTLSQIAVQGQSTCGLACGGRSMYVDSLTSINTAPAVLNESDLVLINGNFAGGSASVPAITNNARIFARNITTSGYSKAISDLGQGRKIAAPTGMTINDYSSYGCLTLFPSPLRSINLPIKRPPDVEWEQDTAKWANINDYKTGNRTDVQALQAAIDDPKKTSIIMPDIWHTIDSPVYIRGNIKRIVGTCRVACEWGVSGPILGTFVITDGTAPVVQIERLNCQGTSIFQQSSRTVIVEAVTNEFEDPKVDNDRADGTGDLFLIDCVARLKVTNPKAHVWAWQFNSEQQSYFFNSKPDTSQAYNLKMLGGTAWIFGYKTEVYGTKGHFYNAVAELLGFYNYAGCRGRAEPTQFYAKESNISIVSGTQLVFGCPLYDTLVTVVRGGVTKNLLATQTNPVLEWENYTIPLFSNFDSTMVSVRDPRAMPAAGIPAIIDIQALPRKNIAVTWSGSGRQSATMRLFDARGTLLATREFTAGAGGIHCAAISVPSSGTYFVDVQSGSERSVRKVMIVD